MVGNSHPTYHEAQGAGRRVKKGRAQGQKAQGTGRQLNGKRYKAKGVGQQLNGKRHKAQGARQKWENFRI